MSKIEHSLFYNDSEILFAAWWEPNPDKCVEDEIIEMVKSHGSNNYMVRAPRIRDWQEFKNLIIDTYKDNFRPMNQRDIFRTQDIAEPPEPNYSKYNIKMEIQLRLWKLASLILIISLGICLYVKLNSEKLDVYFPKRYYSVDMQKKLARAYRYGEGRVVNYERSYFWTLIAGANGVRNSQERHSLETKIASSRIAIIQRNAGKWFEKYRDHGNNE